MAINFGDNSVQSFSGKVIQVKRSLYSSGTTSSSSGMSDITNISFTPKSSSSKIHMELSGSAYIQSEPGGIRVDFYDGTNNVRQGNGLGTDRPLAFRFDFQGGHSGNVYSYACITWRSTSDSWGTSARNIFAQYSSAGGTVGFLSDHAPVTMTITEVIE